MTPSAVRECDQTDKRDELDLIDLTVKKFTRPQLRVNEALLRRELTTITGVKESMLRKLGVDKETLMSDIKFQQLLIDRGLTKDKVPMKWSEAQLKQVPTFAKVSGDFLKLLDNPEYAPYVEARLAHKSTLEESRIERLLGIVSKAGPMLSIPLRYYGAHTGRFSGDGKINLQNLPRKSVIRTAMEAPPGYLCISADLAQIEARITATLAEQNDLVRQFADGKDVYCLFASEFYKRTITKADERERFIGKTAILSLGFGASSAKFEATMNDVFHTPVTDTEANAIVKLYRRRYHKIPQLWRVMDGMIYAMQLGVTKELGPLVTGKRKVILPNGMPIFYPELVNGEYKSGKLRVKLYGAKFLENVVQALARIVMTTAELRLARHRLFAALSIHDELLFVVKEDHAELISGVVKAVLEEPVAWMPKLPIAVEVKIGRNYGECK